MTPAATVLAPTVFGAGSTGWGLAQILAAELDAQSALTTAGGIAILATVLWKVLTNDTTDERARDILESQLHQTRKDLRLEQDYATSLLATLIENGVAPPARPPRDKDD